MCPIKDELRFTVLTSLEIIYYKYYCICSSILSSVHIHFYATIFGEIKNGGFCKNGSTFYVVDV